MLAIFLTLYVCTNAQMDNCELFAVDHFEGPAAISDCVRELPKRRSLIRHMHEAGARDVALGCASPNGGEVIAGPNA